MDRLETAELHTDECAARLLGWRVACAAYLDRWPNCCRSCAATGEVEVDTGNEIDFCPMCVGEERCRRCGAVFHYTDSDSICAHCGWQIGEEMWLPFVPECCCHECDEDPVIGAFPLTGEPIHVSDASRPLLSEEQHRVVVQVFAWGDASRRDADQE